jgi:signal transduction histidine kinase
MFNNKPLIILITVVLCAVIILLAHIQFFNARESTMRLYSEKQTVLAKQVALSVEKFFDERISALKLLAGNIALNPNKQEKYLPQFSSIYHIIGLFESIVYMDRKGEIAAVYPPLTFSLNSDQYNHAKALIQSYNKKPDSTFTSVICTHNLLNSDMASICLRVPVYGKDKKFFGLILGIISIGSSLNSFLTPTIEQEEVHTFILSNDGVLLYYPTRPEMIRKNIKDNSGACLTCHNNFDLEERMLVEQSGWGEKRNVDKERRLLSFSKINLPGDTWSVGIDMPYSRITKANSTQFIAFFLLSALMMLVVLIGSIALYRINKEKILIEKKHELNRLDHLAFIGEMSTRIAHEIKNPLASLQAGIQLLESNLVQNEKTKEYFQKLTSEVQRVDRIVKGLLSYSREEQLSKKDTDIRQLVEKVVALNKQSIKDKKISWTVNGDDKNFVVTIDPLKMEQVIWNLILNAVQAIKEEGEIKVSIVNSSPDLIQCIISDSGTGMTEEVQNKIFKPFFSTKSQGTGLGLAITKKIVVAHGGKININSKPGEGTTVKISLPR